MMIVESRLSSRAFGRGLEMPLLQSLAKALVVALAFYATVRLADMARLNLEPPTVLCRATDHIREQIDFIADIEQNGFAYRTSDGIYFDTSKQPDYGHLARLDVKGQADRERRIPARHLPDPQVRQPHRRLRPPRTPVRQHQPRQLHRVLRTDRYAGEPSIGKEYVAAAEHETLAETLAVERAVRDGADVRALFENPHALRACASLRSRSDCDVVFRARSSLALHCFLALSVKTCGVPP